MRRASPIHPLTQSSHEHEHTEYYRYVLRFPSQAKPTRGTMTVRSTEGRTHPVCVARVHTQRDTHRHHSNQPTHPSLLLRSLVALALTATIATALPSCNYTLSKGNEWVSVWVGSWDVCCVSLWSFLPVLLPSLISLTSCCFHTNTTNTHRSRRQSRVNSMEKLALTPL